MLATAAFLAPFRQAFLGPLRSSDVAAAADLLPRELAFLLLPAVLTLAIGVYPLPVLELLRPSAEAWVAGSAGLL